ncbi:endonuclease domain-containing protein [Aeromonas sanarellii]|uniref:endonuclease domain-containing protein n=1 Tax=Aeromonas TaxID=642 RepID=UPI001C245A8B|nr:endonuclease domain-containing protein [Aeromonas sp. FDAARGOS 1409]QXC30100.1 endonuclease domain-containing protein [Aeromonas sp. FDAARGOS 1409]
MSERPVRIFNREATLDKRREQRGNPTEPERRLWQLLRAGQLGVKFRRQQGIGPYIADFYCPERLLMIEVDGDSHFDERGLSHDKQRDAYMAALSLTVLRFSNREVMQNLPGVVVSIRAWLDHV